MDPGGFDASTAAAAAAGRTCEHWWRPHAAAPPLPRPWRRWRGCWRARWRRAAPSWRPGWTGCWPCWRLPTWLLLTWQPTRPCRRSRWVMGLQQGGRVVGWWVVARRNPPHLTFAMQEASSCFPLCHPTLLSHNCCFTATAPQAGAPNLPVITCTAAATSARPASPGAAAAAAAGVGGGLPGR